MMGQQQSLTGRAGYTLLELLLAVAVLALITGILAMVLRMPRQALEQADIAAVRQRDAGRTLQRMFDDLTAVPLAEVGEFILAARMSGETAGEVLRCTSRAGLALGEEHAPPMLVRIWYRLVEDVGRPGELLVYRGQAPWVPHGTLAGEEYLLCRSVRRLSCRCLDSAGEEHGQWPPAALAAIGQDEATAPPLPARVECRLELAAGQGNRDSVVWPMTVLLPPGLNGSWPDSAPARERKPRSGIGH